MNNWAILILRLGLGVVFVAHGLQKSFGMFRGPGILGFSQMLSGLGFAPALFWAYLAAYVELLGGLCVISGFLTRIASLLLFVLITVAGIKVHFTKGFFLQAGGFEYIFVLASICIALIIVGPGKFSLFKKS